MNAYDIVVHKGVSSFTEKMTLKSYKNIPKILDCYDLTY